MKTRNSIFTVLVSYILGIMGMSVIAGMIAGAAPGILAPLIVASLLASGIYLYQCVLRDFKNKATSRKFRILRHVLSGCGVALVILPFLLFMPYFPGASIVLNIASILVGCFIAKRWVYAGPGESKGADNNHSPMMNFLKSELPQRQLKSFRLSGEVEDQPSCGLGGCIKEFSKIVRERLPRSYEIYDQGNAVAEDGSRNTEGIALTLADNHHLYAWINAEEMGERYRWSLMVSERYSGLYKDRNLSHFTVSPSDERVKNWKPETVVRAKAWDFVSDVMNNLATTNSSGYANTFFEKQRFSLQIVQKARDLQVFMEDSWIAAQERADVSMGVQQVPDQGKESPGGQANIPENTKKSLTWD